MQQRVVVLGSLNADLIYYVPRIPVAGETLSGAEFLTAPGGKGLNQAVACAKLGAPYNLKVTMLGAFGDDPNSIMLRRAMQTANVDDSHVKTVSVPSGTALIQVIRSTGENRITISAGANGMVTPDLVAAGDWKQSISTAAALVMQMELSLETVIAGAEVAHSRGVPVFLNVAPAYVLPANLYRMIDYLIVNEIEAEQLTDIKVDTLQAAEKACEVLKSRGIRKSVILTRGADGSTVLDVQTGDLHNIPAEEVQVVDTTGAGDAFIGALVSRIVHGDSLRKAATYAGVAGSLAVERAGGSSSIPSPEDVAESRIRFKSKRISMGYSDRDTDSE